MFNHVDIFLVVSAFVEASHLIQHFTKISLENIHNTQLHIMEGIQLPLNDVSFDLMANLKKMT